MITNRLSLSDVEPFKVANRLFQSVKRLNLPVLVMTPAGTVGESIVGVSLNLAGTLGNGEPRF